MLDKYPEEVKLVFKNFPLRRHKFASKAAVAALAAKKQGKFWEFHDKLFENVSRLSDQKIQEIARELGLNQEAFERDMKAPEMQGRISRDTRDGKKAGVRGTPTIFVNGRRIPGSDSKGVEKNRKR